MIQQTDRIAMIGARGFVGEEIAGILAKHSGAELVTLGTRNPEEALGYVATSASSRLILPEDMTDLVEDHDLVILAVPNNDSSDYVSASPDGARVIDLGATFRTSEGWLYGLPETNDVDAEIADKIANPGCYATGSILALYPFKDLLAPDHDVNIVGLSGFSGGGNRYRDELGAPRVDLHNASALPYGVHEQHAHLAEISANLGIPKDQVLFQPIIVDTPRGIVLTIRAMLHGRYSQASLNELAKNFYADNPLVIKTDKDLVNPAEMANIDECVIGRITAEGYKDRYTRITMTAGLDNLRKGAAVQAVQNLNLMLGKPELQGIVG